MNPLCQIVTILALCSIVSAQAVTQPGDTPSLMVLQMQSMLEPDPTIADPNARDEALARSLRGVVELVEQFDQAWPESEYRPVAHVMGLRALIRLRAMGDGQVREQEILAAAESLKDVAVQPEHRALAELMRISAAQNLRLQAATQPADRHQAMIEATEELVAMAGEYPRSGYAPSALYSAAEMQIDLGREERALELIDQLAERYPRDSYCYHGLLLARQVHLGAGRDEQARQVAGRILEQFPDTPGAIRLRAQRARQDCLGRPVHLHFEALDGSQFDMRDQRGQVVMIYFFLSAASARSAEAVATEILALQDAIAGRAVLVAVGMDSPAHGESVHRLLSERGVDCPVLLDPQGQVAQHYGVLMASSMAVADAEGNLTAVLDDEDLLGQVRGWLDGAEAPASQPAAPDGR